MKKYSVLLIAVLIFSSLTATSIYATVQTSYVKKLPFRFDVKPPWAGGGNPKNDKVKVNILNIPDGEKVKGQVHIIAEAEGTFSSVEYYDTAANTWNPMSFIENGERYYAVWDASSYTGGTSLTVAARDSEGNTLASDTVNVDVVQNYVWSLVLEVDYIQGHYPSTTALDYLVEYWAGFAIDVDVHVDDGVEDPNGDGVISSGEFWGLESYWNDVLTFDDQADDGVDSDSDGYDEEFLSPEKWILWGTYDANPDVGGYTYVIIDGKDGLAGNYIYIADGMIDGWEASNGVTGDGGEVVVALHELGHSIGILNIRGRSEKYDSDTYSVMSYIRVQNAEDMDSTWYYSDEYWDTKNLNFYISN